MAVISEGRLTFTFPSDDASKYDDWSFYRNQFNAAFGGTKAIDIIFVDDDQAWLIEVKDYRANRRTKALDLGDEVAFKVRDTLAGLAAAKCNATEVNEARLARKALRKSRLRVVLHLEQPAKPSKLFPLVVDPSKLLIKLRQRLKSVDARISVVNQHRLKPDMNWTVAG
jgi:hypothetical protein